MSVGFKQPDGDLPDPVAMALRHRRFWAFFCDKSDVTCDVPLFAMEGTRVATVQKGRRPRTYLARSPAMEALVLSEVGKIVADQAAGGTRFDGLVYGLCVAGADGPEPLFIGHVESKGPGGGLAEALEDISPTQAHAFAGWGYTPDTYLGALSAVVTPHPEGVSGPRSRQRRYEGWADTLFESPWQRRIPKRPVAFFARAWDRAKRGPWLEFGPTGVRSLVAQLIAVAAAVFPALLDAPGEGP